ncbi:Uncharacterised protein [Bordetella pertussis]|nr:Uncharacterised protein [Bordetella pertussis]
MKSFQRCTSTGWGCARQSAPNAADSARASNARPGVAGASWMRSTACSYCLRKACALAGSSSPRRASAAA